MRAFGALRALNRAAATPPSLVPATARQAQALRLSVLGGQFSRRAGMNVIIVARNGRRDVELCDRQAPEFGQKPDAQEASHPAEGFDSPMPELPCTKQNNGSASDESFLWKVERPS